MAQKHSEETIAQARMLCETTGMSYDDIGAKIGGVPGPTVGSWKRRFGWVRSPLARTRKPIPKERRDLGVLLRRAGLAHDEVAHIIGCHPETARRFECELEDALGPPLCELAPELFTALCDALTRGGSGRRELVRLAERAFGLAAADLMRNRTLAPDRRARGMALVVASIRALPDDGGPAPGASLHDQLSMPATFDETSLLLEELTRRFAAFDAGGLGEGAPGEPGAAAAAAPP